MAERGPSAKRLGAQTVVGKDRLVAVAPPESSVASDTRHYFPISEQACVMVVETWAETVWMVASAAARSIAHTAQCGLSPRPVLCKE
jgi:hypothetical protein